MAKKLSCVSCGSLKRFPHTFTTQSPLSSNEAALPSLVGGAESARRGGGGGSQPPHRGVSLVTLGGNEKRQQ